MDFIHVKVVTRLQKVAKSLEKRYFPKMNIYYQLLKGIKNKPNILTEKNF